jgi:hypothetical protein
MSGSYGSGASKPWWGCRVFTEQNASRVWLKKIAEHGMPDSVLGKGRGGEPLKEASVISADCFGAHLVR